MKKALLGLILLGIASCSSVTQLESKYKEVPVAVVCVSDEFTNMMYKAVLKNDEATNSALVETRKCIGLPHRPMAKVIEVLSSQKDQDGDVTLLVKVMNPQGQPQVVISWPELVPGQDA